MILFKMLHANDCNKKALFLFHKFLMFSEITNHTRDQNVWIVLLITGFRMPFALNEKHLLCHNVFNLFSSVDILFQYTPDAEKDPVY